MSMPVRHLPVVQNFDCHGCTHCCREYDIIVTEEERKRLMEQDWSDDPDIGKEPILVRTGWLSNAYRLNHRKDHGCIFLADDGRCKIHVKHGGHAKPLACRLFPFTLSPAKGHWRVGVRHACPSVAENMGTPVTERAAELGQLARDFESAQEIGDREIPSPPLSRGVQASWTTISRLVEVLAAILDDDSGPIGWRLRRCLAFSRLCRSARLDELNGASLREFLDVMADATARDTPKEPSKEETPGWIGRIIFRQFAAMHSRKDRGKYQGLPVRRGRIALLMAGCRFAKGSGPVPKMNRRMADRSFAELEQDSPNLIASADGLLERYFQQKLTSMQFFGPVNFHLPLWDGLDSLALVYPLIIWLARSIEENSPEASLSAALSIVDDHFGYNPILNTARYKWALRVLSSRDELTRLIAWYSR